LPTDKRGDLGKGPEEFTEDGTAGRFTMETRRMCFPEALCDKAVFPRDDRDAGKSPGPLPGGVDMLDG